MCGPHVCAWMCLFQQSFFVRLSLFIYVHLVIEIISLKNDTSQTNNCITFSLLLLLLLLLLLFFNVKILGAKKMKLKSKVGMARCLVLHLLHLYYYYCLSQLLCQPLDRIFTYRVQKSGKNTIQLCKRHESTLSGIHKRTEQFVHPHSLNNYKIWKNIN